MANFTDLYRRRGHHIAIVIMGDDVHHPVNDENTSFPTKPTWKSCGVPLIPGHIYAALQSFIDLSGNVNQYSVLRLVDLTEKGWDQEIAKAKSFGIYSNAKRSNLAAFDDPVFMLEALSLGLITKDEYAEFLKPVTPLVEEHIKAKGTLRF